MISEVPTVQIVMILMYISMIASVWMLFAVKRFKSYNKWIWVPIVIFFHIFAFLVLLSKAVKKQ